METEKNKHRIVEVKQIALYCPQCSAKLELAEYYSRRIHNFALTICLLCGGSLYTSDVDQPSYMRDLREKVRMETEIRRICAVSGKTIRFVENYARENKLSAADLKSLAEKIIHKDWNFEVES